MGEAASPEEDSEVDPEEDYSEEHSSEDVELANKKNQVQKEDSIVEDFLESKELFDLFGSKKRKRNVIYRVKRHNQDKDDMNPEILGCCSDVSNFCRFRLQVN